GSTAGVCGDSVVDELFGEQCDDGNRTNGDGCSSVCEREGCGNGKIESPEQCDDGNLTDGDGCEHDCRLTDSDGDGVPDIFDNCPTVSNPGQENSHPGAVTYVFDHTAGDRDVFEAGASIFDPDGARGGWLRAEGMELEIGRCSTVHSF